MNDRAEFEDGELIDRFRASFQCEDRAATQRLYSALSGRADGSTTSSGPLQRFLAACSPLQRPRTRVRWIVLLTALFLVASGAAVAGSNILNLGKPVSIQSTNAYFPVSGFHRIKTNLRLYGKPELFFMGVQGPVDKVSVERWPLVKALEQFGTLTGVKAVERGCTIAGGGIMSAQAQCASPSFDLSRSRFTSKYLAFVSKDLTRDVDNKTRRFQALNPTENALYTTYVRFRGTPRCIKMSPPGHIVYYPCHSYEDYVNAAANSEDLRTLPLITIGGYLQTVSEDLSPTDLTRTIALTALPGGVSGMGFIQGLPFDTVRQALSTGRDPAGVSNLVEHVNAEANIITALICHADGKKPVSVCNRPVIKAILQHVK